MLGTKFLVIAFSLPFVYTNCRFPNANQLSAHSQRLYSQAPAKIPYLPYIILKPNSYVSIGNEKGKTYKFKFTATDNEFITIETFGREDTKLKVYNSSNKKFLTDDDSGEDRNARIGFLATKNTDYFIYSKLYQQEKGGNYSIQLRRQNFAMFGCNIPNDINTAPDFDYPSYLYSNTYECHKYINKSAEDARKEDQRRLAPLNSELVFFSGHGIAYKNAGTGYGLNSIKMVQSQC